MNDISEITVSNLDEKRFISIETDKGIRPLPLSVIREVEQIKKPEINLPELLRVLDHIKFEYGEEIHYNGTNFLLIPTDETDESDNHAEAVFHTSTAIDGFDIYLLNSLSGAEKRRRLFHEILEADLRGQGFEQDEAHDIAKTEEQKKFGSKEE